MIGLRWEQDVTFTLPENEMVPHYLLKDPDGTVWSSYYKTSDGFRIYNTNNTYWKEIDAKNYCETIAKVEIETKIEFLKSLVRD